MQAAKCVILAVRRNARFNAHCKQNESHVMDIWMTCCKPNEYMAIFL